MTDLWRLASMRRGATLAAFRKESESIKKLSKVIKSHQHRMYWFIYADFSSFNST
jgi:hypothetical protein